MTALANRESGTYVATKTELTFLILQLNMLIDSGLHKGVSIDDVHDQIEFGTIFPWLKRNFASDIDLSIYANSPSAGDITKGLQRLQGAYAGDEDRKWGVRNNGICLLLAWVNELVQQGQYRV